MSTTWCAPCLPGPLPVPGWRDGARTHISGGRQQRPTRTLRLPETPGSVHSRHSAGACLLGSHIAVRDASHAFLCENTSQMGKACSPEHRTCQHLKMSAPLAWPGLSRLKAPPSVSVSLLPPAGATPRLHPGHDTPSREARGAPRPHSALSVATVTAGCHLLPSRDSQSCAQLPPEGCAPHPRRGRCREVKLAHPQTQGALLALPLACVKSPARPSKRAALTLLGESQIGGVPPGT